MENVIGWYHSHPGYGCWLSGIDCSTQMLNQQYQEPWLAIVIDPNRTAATGKVEIGAFRTYPQGYKPPDADPNDFESIPLNKIEDFGAHQSQYYQLEISYFKSVRVTAQPTSAYQCPRAQGTPRNATHHPPSPRRRRRATRRC